jgi:Mlc titration factor MtfA (ptsG expression regulator)
VVYPNEFVVPRQIEDDSGVVHEFTDVLSGEAWEGGPLIISWHDVQMAGDGYNVVIHEFAHKLDMLNGEADGIPALHSGIAERMDRDIFCRLRRFLPARRQRRGNGHRPLRQRRSGRIFRRAVGMLF